MLPPRKCLKDDDTVRGRVMRAEAEECSVEVFHVLFSKSELGLVRKAHDVLTTSLVNYSSKNPGFKTICVFTTVVSPVGRNIYFLVVCLYKRYLL